MYMGAEILIVNNQAPPRRSSSRPLANPDLFKPTPVGPTQGGQFDDSEGIYRQPSPAARQPSPGAGKGGKKWQPLTTIAPNPESEDNNPFSLGDSDEEDESKAKSDDPEKKKVAADSAKPADDSASKPAAGAKETEEATAAKS